MLFFFGKKTSFFTQTHTIIVFPPTRTLPHAFSAPPYFLCTLTGIQYCGGRCEGCGGRCVGCGGGGCRGGGARGSGGMDGGGG